MLLPKVQNFRGCLSVFYNILFLTQDPQCIQLSWPLSLLQPVTVPQSFLVLRDFNNYEGYLVKCYVECPLILFSVDFAWFSGDIGLMEKYHKDGVLFSSLQEVYF